MKDWKLLIIIFAIVGLGVAILLLRIIIPRIGVNVTLSVAIDNPRGVNVSS